MYGGGKYFVLAVDRTHIKYADVQEPENMGEEQGQNVTGVQC